VGLAAPASCRGWSGWVRHAHNETSRSSAFIGAMISGRPVFDGDAASRADGRRAHPGARAPGRSQAQLAPQDQLAEEDLHLVKGEGGAQAAARAAAPGEIFLRREVAPVEETLGAELVGLG